VCSSDLERTCGDCGAQRIIVDTTVQVANVNANKAILTVNGQFTIVRNDLCKAMIEDLNGFSFEPFDGNGQYFYLQAKSRLKKIIIKNDEVLNFKGNCPQCNAPKYDMFFGPLRYLKREWSGDDIVHSDFQDNLLFTEKAFNVIKKFENEITMDGIALFE
jgi:hypothetical protein